MKKKLSIFLLIAIYFSIVYTLFGYYDPDNGTNNRWWEDDNAYESVYRLATPKSSRIK